ncbi:Seven transmembrane protein 1 [Spironucleus salmonicida]|uniref:PQ-loop motif-containing protein n=1 Tax=Spironucleus salmonicida TaxID=348837 RepID=V6M2U2_9EUKA|nr:Seven transmembrane protein 1 [Spironucleus salmonicida]|eukprot:EST47584.1 PQ-loop motif-containing protein [Spironucleus salmonicida]
MQCICGQQNKIDPIYFINASFNTCIYTNLQLYSFIFGWISLSLWIIALYPQARDQFITREVGALSAWLIFQWLGADFLNLVSVFILDLLFTQKILAVIWITTDIVLVFQQIFFRNSKNTGVSIKLRPLEIIIYLLIISTVIISIVIYGILQAQLFKVQPTKYSTCSEGTLSNWRRIFGNILSYTAIPFYIMTRPFQIYKNYKRRSVEGLSIVMFIIALLANVTQFITLLIDTINTKINSPNEVNYDQIAFYIAAIVPACLDAVILAQFVYYRKFTPSKNNPSFQDEETKEEKTADLAISSQV